MAEALQLMDFLSRDLALPLRGVAATVALLDEGATVPFIARYRKEVTGGLDEVQIRAIEERRTQVVELEARREVVLTSIDGQGKLSEVLEKAIRAATTRAALEDLYLPFRPKRRTRASIAREKGLEPLAQRILAQPDRANPLQEAQAYLKPEADLPDAEAALKGARDIVAEVVAEDIEVRRFGRDTMARHGRVTSVAQPRKDKAAAPSRFEGYADFAEAVATIPSHRYLAVCRGEREEDLRVGIELDRDRLMARTEQRMGLRPRSPYAGHLAQAIQDGVQRLLLPSLETDVRGELKERSDRQAVDVFAQNLRNLLLASPLGGQRVVGVDPGIRSGCKCAAVDETGRFLGSVTVYPGQGVAASAKAVVDLQAFLLRHQPTAVGVGNGTAGRETEAFARDVLAKAGWASVPVVSVNEAGASVYSASDLAREEFPDLDLTIRGAISIARRLQDPLAELVKVEPKAIGVGQYQHDVHQTLLARKLNEVVESCVNHVGVELNTASAPLLAHVAGIGPGLARKVVAHRDQHGPFRSRHAVLKVSGLGPRAYEQAAGFLRVRGGEHPLDASAVHPERYGIVERMAADLGVKVAQLVGNAGMVQTIDLRRYLAGDVGEPTLRDILAELQKPGRDPRKSFEPPKFRDDVRTLDDLRQGMSLEGVVTNVTPFGAFVDVGVHQDGLVHVSQLSERFVRDPHEVVAVGQRLQVRVLEVDLKRRRISLSARPPSAGEGVPA
jgi:uncharacterized protein